jgi:hypothetical protein
MQVRMNVDRTGTGAVIAAIGILVAWIMLVVTILIGWIMNIADLANMSDIVTGEGILRIVGIFAFPVGAVMGWFF